MKYVLTATACAAAVLAVFSPVAGAETGASVSGAVPCADPAADIELALISKSGPGTGRVRITGVMKNLGTVAWTATGPSHHLQAVLARQDAGTQPDGEPVQPAIAIRELAPGRQYRIDYQTDWDAGRKAPPPRFILRFFDAGRIGTRPDNYHPDCRADNNRKEITAADIDKLFQPAAPPPPLKVESYRLLGGIGVNTVETQLVYRRGMTHTGKLAATVAAPYAGASDDAPLSGNSGTVKIRVHIPCDARETPGTIPPPVTITYRLWGTLGLPGGSGWVPGFSLDQSIPYRELCGPGPADKP
ncbi:hypothetical protein SCL_0139 [Sulfuricaulis limicola]|uniref:Uncharacterized protein n=1 Tax=Sulfuricaulis limicola TaxID=1620215 RepID=A0A1B4XCC6_9GAMM|nr:hypothetical protein [Sulfuricaulis limicola]BAV32463.1 hypothetical protein SCL_0139 [Sulfuricaulis limicola]